ncbi:MAG: hypothetical protein ACYDDO_02210 [Acidiferrobacterales bacterium]
MSFVTFAAKAQLSIGAGVDVSKARGTQAVFLTYQPRTSHLDFLAGAWRGRYYGQAYGIAYRCNFGQLFGTFGAAYLPKVNNISGTHANFNIELGYQMTPRWGILWQHFSNGKGIFRWTTRANAGWNFLVLKYTFDSGVSAPTKSCIR